MKRKIDPESYLARLYAPDPPPELEARVLAAGQAAWREDVAAAAPASGFCRGIKIFSRVAALVLLAMVVLDRWSLSDPADETEPFRAEVEQLVQLGLPRDCAMVMVAAGRNKSAAGTAVLLTAVMEGDIS
ncbi:MAG: hypothetical protein PHQ27_10320 [Victivallales bacterium]|nr:hypothetical protein [Victivallales bacterium]